MARYELLSEEHRGKAIVIARLIGQAETETISRLGAVLGAQAAKGTPLHILLDEGDLRPGLLLPYHVRGLVDDWRAVLRRENVRLAAYAPNPVIHGLNRLGLSIAARDTGDRVKVFARRDEALDWLVGG